MFKPAKPHGERKPLTNIMKPPNKTPINEPKTAPTTNVKREVNSTFGGLGVNCSARHRAVKTLIKAILVVFSLFCTRVGWIIQPYKLFEPSLKILICFNVRNWLVVFGV
jgi:hypothetical protein